MSEKFDPTTDVPRSQPAVRPDTQDNWVHRSKGMRCSTCVYYVEKRIKGSDGTERKSIGRCRRHGPTLSGWPAVFPTDWCGDHKLDEEKL